MTNLEAICSYPALADVPDNLIAKIFIDRELDGSATYSAVYKQKVELCAADVMVEIVCLPDFSESELSIKYSRADILANAMKIYKRYVDPKLSELNNDPTIEDCSYLW